MKCLSFVLKFKLSNAAVIVMAALLSTGGVCAHAQTVGDVYTVAGNGMSPGTIGSTALTSGIGYVNSTVFDSSGNMFFSETDCNCIRKVTQDGSISVFWSIPNVNVYAITSITMDAQNNLYAAVYEQNYFHGASANCTDLVGIYEVTPSGSSSLYAGGGCWKNAPVNNSPALGSNMGDIIGMTFSNGNMYIADARDDMAYEITGGVFYIIAGNATNFGGYSGDGGPATAAQLAPSGVAAYTVTTNGIPATTIYISDAIHNVVRVVDSNGIINTYAGSAASGAGFSGDGGLASNSQLCNPLTLTVDNLGNLYIADTCNNVIREVTTYNGIISTFAGAYPSNQTYSGDGTPATSAMLNAPGALAFSPNRSLYFFNDDFYIRQVYENPPVHLHPR